MTRHRSKTTTRVAGVLIALGLLAAACGSSDPGSGTATTAPATTAAGGTETTAPAVDVRYGGELIVAHVSNPSSLDPNVGGSGNDHMSIYPFYDRLINFNPENLEPLPGLAESWNYPDTKTLVLNLREGVLFHDGTPFNAEAVKYNLDRARGITLETSTSKADTAVIADVVASGEFEVTITFTRDDAALLLILADRPGMMGSPTAFEALGEDFGRSPVGTGPFEFVEWLPNERLVGKKSENYWQEGLPYLDGFTMRYIPDQQTAVNALLAGEIDFSMKVAQTSVEQLKANSDLTVSVANSLSHETCYFNHSRPPMNNRAFRLAVSHAIDRESLNQLFAFGLGVPAHAAYPPGYWAASEERYGYFAFDQDLAKKYLAEAGFPDGTTIKGVAYDASGQARKNEIIQAMLAEVGIDMQFEVMEVGAATRTFFSDPFPYDIYCSGWSGRPDPSQTANSLFGSPSFYNAGDYASPGMAEALAKAGASSDQTVRAAGFADVIKLAQEDALYIPVLHNPDINAFQNYVGGFTPNLYGKIDISFLWVEK